MALLEVEDLKKTYTARYGGQAVHALTGVSFSLEEGQFAAVMGESGSGKTTLLNVVATLDRPTAGTVRLDGRDTAAVPERELAAFRRENLGFVFQEFNLLDTFNLRDNILLPMVLAGKSREEMEAALPPLAKKLGIGDILSKYPYEVSGGQKQRAAVARALILSPRLVLADEPTGALDSVSSDALLALLDAVNTAGQTVLMATHSVKAASHAGRVLFIKDGTLYHQLFRGADDRVRFYGRISDALTAMAGGRDDG